MGRFITQDWEEVEAKVFKKHWETSFPINQQDLYYKDLNRLIFQEDSSRELKKDRFEKIKLILRLLKRKSFFTEKQKQVVSLLFGWNRSVFVGPRGFSDIAKIMHIKQPVVYNHFKASVKKIKRYYIKKYGS